MTADTADITTSGGPNVGTSKRPRRKAKPVRDYEAEFAAELVARGLEVLDARQEVRIDPDVALRQFMPKLPDPVTGKVTSYLLDFAWPSVGLYVEIDGFAGTGRSPGAHRTWTGFHRDRRKDRTMVAGGWRGLRFGPQDLHTAEDVAQAVGEVLDMLWVLSHCTGGMPVRYCLPSAEPSRRRTRRAKPLIEVL